MYRGVNPAKPSDAIAGATGTSGSASVTVGSVNASTQGDRLVMLQGALNNPTGAGWTPPSGMTEEGQLSSDSLVSAGVADETLAQSGSSGAQSTAFQGGTTLTTEAAALVAFSPPEPTYYLHDQLGSTRLLADQGGKVIGAYTYDSYGQLASETCNAQALASNPLGYAGSYTDATSGFIHLVNRRAVLGEAGWACASRPAPVPTCTRRRGTAPTPPSGRG